MLSGVNAKVSQLAELDKRKLQRKITLLGQLTFRWGRDNNVLILLTDSSAIEVGLLDESAEHRTVGRAPSFTFITKEAMDKE